MKPIIRGTGFTESERYLAALSEKTFLDLWSYPNSFIDKKSGGKGDGKELCDLFVVFGDDVLIFSDKYINWPDHDDVNIAWARWYKRAVEKSVAQIRGAERWLYKFPDRIFLDQKCENKLPMDIPSGDGRRVHGIAVALGAAKAADEFWETKDGALRITPALKGCGHTDQSTADYQPFAIGDVDPSGSFVHVFDQAGLDLVMAELDTVSDFVRYLNLRADAIRNERVISAENEGDLLAFYLQNEDENGHHTFQHAQATADAKIVLGDGLYDELQTRPKYIDKCKADEISYRWDHLIRNFTKHVLNDTAITPVNYERATANQIEFPLRAMASENRTMRRALGECFVGALMEAESRLALRFSRTILPLDGMADPESAYVFLVYACRKDQDYEKYRQVRASMLETYCYMALYDNRHLKRAIGIAVDASPKVTGRKGGSEDLMEIEVTEWTEELCDDVEARRKAHDVKKQSEKRISRLRTQEFPDQAEPKPSLTRQQRRAAARRFNKMN